MAFVCSFDIFVCILGASQISPTYLLIVNLRYIVNLSFMISVLGFMHLCQRGVANRFNKESKF